MSRSRALPLAACAAACAVAALAIAAAVPIVFGVPARQVHVVWRADATSERLAAEIELRLTEARRLDGDRWSYVPADPRPETLRRLATHPAVISTDGISPDTYDLSPSAPLTERRGGMISPTSRFGARAAQLAAYTLGAAAAALFAWAIVAARGSTPRRAVAGVAKLAMTAATAIAVWLRVARAALRAHAARLPRPGVVAVRLLSLVQRGVPAASADAAGLFRIVFGVSVLLYLASDRVSSATITTYELTRAEGLYARVMALLAATPALVDGIHTIIWVAGLLFVAGIATPVTYATFTAAVIVWASVRALGASHHVVSSLAVGMLLLLPARWGDGLSVDASLRRRFGATQRPPSRRYGFAIWAPAFVFAVAFAAAAWSKLRQADWVANGSVKYHFISDFNQALVPWGLELATYPRLAVALSAAAVVAEIVVITAVFSTSTAYRLACGLLALGMLITFALFQGIVWPGWWILLLGFLPWHRFRPGAGVAAAATAKPLSAAQVALMLAVVTQQVYASWARIEARPFVSAYDMYSTTYADPAAYEEASNLIYRVVAVTPAGREDLSDCTIDSPAAETFSRAIAGDQTERARMRSLIGECVVDRADVTQVGIEGDKKVFDWQARRFVWKRAIDVVGPADAAWLRDRAAK